MCSRLSQILPHEAMEQLFAVDVLSNLQPRYNLAPTQDAWVVDLDGEERRLRQLRWGLVPGWAKDLSIGSKTINARSETVAEKPSFRAAFRARRCLVPADGFYEWRKGTNPRQPYRFVLKDGGVAAFAGLWEENQPLGVTTFTVLTTVANGHLDAIGHDRMPVILDAENFDLWLSPESDPADLLPVLRPLPDAAMDHFPVSTRLNSPKNDDPSVIEPVTDVVPAQGDLFG